MNQIVCLSTSPWYPIPTRKQQVMSRIPDAQILYFDPPVTVIAPLKDPSAREKLLAYRKPGVHPQENITVYCLPPVLPFFQKCRFINRINQWRMARFIRRKMTEHGFDAPILWVYSPVACDATDNIPHRALVYDCVDRHSAYGGLMNPVLVDQMEAQLAGTCDVVFATATALSKRLCAFNDKTYMIPNGANFERFFEASREQPCPAGLAGIPHPIFGFVGALQSCIEYRFVRAAAAARPDWHFVFIGAEKPGVDLSSLKSLSNVHFLGLVPHEKLPSFLAQFDVCLNLFAKSNLSKDVSPLKFYEYLATGKPIISTYQPDQVLQYESLIYLCRTATDFVEKCEKSLLDQSEERRDARIAEGRKSAWDARVAQMCEILRTQRLI